MPPAHVFLVTVAYFSIKWREQQPCPACSWMTTDAKSPGLSEPLCHVPPRVLEEPPVPGAGFSGGQLQVVCTRHTGTQCLGAGGG